MRSRIISLCAFAPLCLCPFQPLPAQEPSTAPSASAAQKAPASAGRIIRRHDLLKITFRYPGQSYGVLNQVQKSGEIGTPNGVMVKAAGLTIPGLISNIMESYAEVPGHEELRVEASIASSPYSVVRILPGAKTRTPTVLPRKFKEPLTVWRAIQDEGGFPPGANPRNVRLLKADVTRKVLDCSGKDGQPDGAMLLESGDYLFLVPDDVEITKLFEP